jgi:hypothetical protein
VQAAHKAIFALRTQVEDPKIHALSEPLPEGLGHTQMTYRGRSQRPRQ